MDIKPDVNTMRVLYRMGLAASESEDPAVAAARRLNPEYPGEIDAPLWKIGRTWCRYDTPRCWECPVRDVCPTPGNKTVIREKPVEKEFEPVITATDRAADEIARSLPVDQWEREVRYLMRKLDIEAHAKGKDEEFQSLMWKVREDITGRIANGEW